MSLLSCAIMLNTMNGFFSKCFISLVFSTLIPVLVVSCREQRTDNKIEDILSIDFSFPDSSQKQSDVFKVMEVVNLETNDSSLIGRISTVISRPSGFYVLDKDMCKQIVKFDRNGRFLYAINKQGRGPGEFLSIYEISVDKEDKDLYLFDAKGMKMICYDAHTGNYVRDFTCNYNAYSFSVLPRGKKFVFYCSFMPNKEVKKDNSFPNFIITDSLGKIKNVSSYFDERIESPNLSFHRTVFCQCDSVLYCFTRYHDDIYEIDESLEAMPVYRLNYMNDNQDKKDKFMRKVQQYGNIDFDRNSRDLQAADIYELSKMTATEKFIYFANSYRKKRYNFLYNKIDRKSLNMNVLEKDVLGDDLYFMDADREYFYLPIPMNILKKRILTSPENYDMMIKNAVADLKDDDNPVIIKVKAKF